MTPEIRKSELPIFVAVVITTATLVWFGNGLTPWWPLMWFAPLPALWYSLRTSWRWAVAAAAAGWLAGSLNLLAYFQAQGTSLAGWLADFGGMALLFAAGVLLFRALVRRQAIWSGMAALPALLVSVDWLRYWTTPHGTSADLAYTQLRLLPFLQLASVTGPWGMSFLLLLTPAFLAVVLSLRNSDRQRARKAGWIIGGVLAAVFIFGAARLAESRPGDSVRVGLIVSDTPKNDDVAAMGADATRLLDAYAAQAKMLAARGAAVVVMPEKAALASDQSQGGADAIFQAIANTADVTLVIGELHVSSTVDGLRRYNRAEVYVPNAAAASYDKEHMLPPFESKLTPGTAKLTMAHGNNIWGVAICKDMDFTSTGRAYGQRKAALMLVPAWDFKLDRVWHGHMAIMRGVEDGFSIARAAKDGNLTVSDAYGRVIAETQSDAEPFTTLLAEVPVGHHWTLFQAWGDWFAWLSVAMLGFVAVRAAWLVVGAKRLPMTGNQPQVGVKGSFAGGR